MNIKEIHKKLIHPVGMIKVLATRAVSTTANILSVATFILVVYNTIILKGYTWRILLGYWWVGILVLIATITYFILDIYLFLPGENNFATITNPPLMEMKKELNEVKKELSDIKKMLEGKQ